MRAIKNFDIILFASPLPLLCLFCLLTFHEASVKKLEEIIGSILKPRLWYNVLLSKWFISWLFMKLQQTNRRRLFISNESSWIFSKNTVSLMSLIVCHYVSSLFDLFLTFHEASAKMLEEIFNGISMPWLGYKVLLSNWLFLTFNEASAKNLKKYLFAS